MGQTAIGQVSAHVDRRGGLTILTWERPTNGSADADRLVDSLGAAFTSRGLTGRECGSGEAPAGMVTGMMWESTAIEVLLSKITPPTGAPRLVVMAVAAPNSIPPLGCDGSA